jgi:hypothetical protein
MIGHLDSRVIWSPEREQRNRLATRSRDMLFRPCFGSSSFLFEGRLRKSNVDVGLYRLWHHHSQNMTMSRHGIGNTSTPDIDKAVSNSSRTFSLAFRASASNPVLGKRTSSFFRSSWAVGSGQDITEASPRGQFCAAISTSIHGLFYLRSSFLLFCSKRHFPPPISSLSRRTKERNPGYHLAFVEGSPNRALL